MLLQLIRTHPRWIAISSLIAFVGVSPGIVIGLSDIFGGPLWPTAPTFSPGPPIPFAIPFDVTNRSALFDLTQLSIECDVSAEIDNDVEGTQRLGFSGVPISVAVTGVSTLHAGERRSYACPLGMPNVFNGVGHPKIKFAELSFRSRYAPYWPLRGVAVSPTFVFNTLTTPQQWRIGRPLK
jgi:hypothetical protein